MSPARAAAMFKNTESAPAGTPPRPETSSVSVSPARRTPIPSNKSSAVPSGVPTRVSRIRIGGNGRVGDSLKGTTVGILEPPVGMHANPRTPASAAPIASAGCPPERAIWRLEISVPSAPTSSPCDQPVACRRVGCRDGILDFVVVGSIIVDELERSVLCNVGEYMVARPEGPGVRCNTRMSPVCGLTARWLSLIPELSRVFDHDLPPPASSLRT